MPPSKTPPATEVAPEASTALAVRSSTDIAQLDEFDQILLGLSEAPDVVDDPEEISREIVMQLLGATTDEELSNFGNAVSWRDEIKDAPVFIDGFRWRKSDYTEGAPIYVIVQGFRADTGEGVITTCGSMNVLAQLSNMARRGTLPTVAAWKLVKAEKATAGGFFPLHLEKVPETVRTLAEAGPSPAAPSPQAA